MVDPKSSCSSKLCPAMRFGEAPDSKTFSSRALFSDTSGLVTFSPGYFLRTKGSWPCPAASSSAPEAGRVSSADVGVMGDGLGSSTGGSGTVFGGGAAVEVPPPQSIASIGARGRGPQEAPPGIARAGASPPKIHSRTWSRALSSDLDELQAATLARGV